MEIVDRNLFINRLKDRLKQKRLTQKELAEQSGIKINTIEKWFSSDGSLPSLNMLCTVAKALDVSLDYFVNSDMDCLTVSNQMIRDETGLSDKAINGLRQITKHDADSADENEMAKMITKSGKDFHLFLRQRMDIVNFILAHPDILEQYIDAFVKCAVPFDFTIPVIKNNKGTWERLSLINNPIALASSDDNLLDNMEIDIIDDYQAMVSRKLDIVQQRMLVEYRKTIPNYEKKALNALKKAYTKSSRIKAK